LSSSNASLDFTTPNLQRRLLCMIYEGMLLFGVLFVTGLVFDISTQSRNASMYRHYREIVYFLTLGAYFVYFWTRSGQTLAMKTWHIKVVDLDNKRLPVVKACVRYVLSWLWFLPGIAIAYQFQLKNWNMVIPIAINVIAWALTSRLNPDGQFQHDVFAKTKLIHSSPILRNDTRKPD